MSDDPRPPEKRRLSRAGWFLAVLAVVLLGVVAFGLAFLAGMSRASTTSSIAMGSGSPAAQPFTAVPSATPTPTSTATRIPSPTPTATVTPSPTPTATPTPIAAITGVNGLGRLETAQYLMQTIVNLQSPPGSLLQQLTGPDQLLLVAQGEVVAGFDMQKVTAADIQVRGTGVHLWLPPPEILYTRVDNNQTYVYERNTGLFRRPDPQLETEARKQAEQQLTSWATQRGILDQAAKFGQVYMEGFLRSLGFTDVKIDVRQSSGF